MTAPCPICKLRLEEAVRRYEATMFARAEIVAREANKLLKMMFAPDAPAGMLAFFCEVMSGEHAS